jgi:hypothetical protein
MTESLDRANNVKTANCILDFGNAIDCACKEKMGSGHTDEVSRREGLLYCNTEVSQSGPRSDDASLLDPALR